MNEASPPCTTEEDSGAGDRPPVGSPDAGREGARVRPDWRLHPGTAYGLMGQIGAVRDAVVCEPQTAFAQRLIAGDGRGYRVLHEDENPRVVLIGTYHDALGQIWLARMLRQLGKAIIQPGDTILLEGERGTLLCIKPTLITVRRDGADVDVPNGSSAWTTSLVHAARAAARIQFNDLPEIAWRCIELDVQNQRLQFRLVLDGMRAAARQEDCDALNAGWNEHGQLQWKREQHFAGHWLPALERGRVFQVFGALHCFSPVIARVLKSIEHLILIPNRPPPTDGDFDDLVLQRLAQLQREERERAQGSPRLIPDGFREG